MNIFSAITTVYLGIASIFAPASRLNLSQIQESVQQTSIVENEKSDFEKAVAIIKKYETLHQPRHWPLVGYGHKVLPGEKFNRNRALSEKEADALLRKDLLKNCAVFRNFGPDSLLLGVLAYNIGSGAALRSSVAKKLKAGDRNIKESYLAHSRYRGKTHTQIQNRRIEEFEALFIESLPVQHDTEGSAGRNPGHKVESNLAHNTQSFAAPHSTMGGNRKLRTTNSMLACTLNSQRYSWQ